MQALQQITAMTMCSAADESSLSTSFMDGGNIQAPCTVGQGGPQGETQHRIHTVLNVLTV